MLNDFIYTCGLVFIVLFIYVVGTALWVRIKKILTNKRNFKCLCKHEYEPHAAFYFKGIEYEFKCRKCGKKISVQTVTDDKFDWIEKE